jgi:hypothetical protein
MPVVGLGVANVSGEYTAQKKEVECLSETLELLTILVKNNVNIHQLENLKSQI